MKRCVFCLAALALAACGGEPRVPTDSGPLPGDAAVDAGTDGGGPICTDGDEDGYGEGCALGPDCDDTDPAISPAATEICNGADDDCDSMTDEALDSPSCALAEGVCAGATARCGDTGFLECDGTDYGADFEADETACDGLDNDCDGSTDEGCTCTNGTTQACGSAIGVCMEGTQTCLDAAWGACEGETAPMGEVCDGLDNDCDGTDDEAGDLTPPDCPLQLGVCAGSRRTCGGTAGWIACSGVASYGGDYQATETLCDGLDNDCDGVIDAGCECTDGSTQACGTDIGACMAGTQTCVAGAWGGCAGEVTPAMETCDGMDEDCDGSTDEAVVAPACALTDGVCAGSTQSCGGAAGFGACTAASYGPTYEATETACDGRDNDCDGVTDEGCTCVDGTTQPCGISTGACTRGMQTCAAGEWGACTGGTLPAPETCNGLDDDCNGASDDALTAPACALDMGVCSGATQSCGGMVGWLPCAGAASYGPTYVATEDGSMNEAICDGRDNDCDGTVDDSCTSGPLVPGAEDVVFPDLYNRNLAYSAQRGGNLEIIFQNLDRGTPTQITTTPEDERAVRISGDRLVYIRGTGAASRAVLYDVATSTETVLSSGQSSIVNIAGPFAVWDELVGGQWDVFVRDLTTGTNTNLGSPITAEIHPNVRGGRIAYVGEGPSSLVTHIREYDGTSGMWGAPLLQTPGSTAGEGHRAPAIDFVMAAWTDGRSITGGSPTITSDWDAYYAPFGAVTGLTTWPGENVLANAVGSEFIMNADSRIMVYDDHNAGDWNVAVATLGGGAPFVITSSSAQQNSISNSGAHLVWHDNRLGSFDIFQAFLGAGVYRAGADNLVIVEVLADPAAGADPNGDGTASTTNDEYVEILNNTEVPIDLSGLTLSDATGVRHTFPAGTWVPALSLVVVFGGGTPTGSLAGAVVHTASSGALGLNNTGDTLTLADGATVIDSVSYGTEANANQSIVRDGATAWLQHSTIPGSTGAYSVGTYVDGYLP